MAENTNGSSNAGNGAGDSALKDFWASDDSSFLDDSDELPLIDEDKLWNEVLESYRSKNPNSYSAKRTVEAAREVGIKSEPSVSARPRSFDSVASRTEANEISNTKSSAGSKKKSESSASGEVVAVRHVSGSAQKSETQNSRTAQRSGTRSSKTAQKSETQNSKTAQKNQKSSADTSRSGNSKSASKKAAAGKTSSDSKKTARNTSAPQNGKSQASRIQKTTSNGTVISQNAKKSKKKSSGKKYKDSRTPGQKIRKFIICLILWIIVIVLCCYAFKLGYDVFYDLPMDSSDLTKIEITIDGYETDIEVGTILLEYDLIDNMFIFRLRCLIYDSDYVAGTYSLSRSYNTEKILNILAGYDYSDGTLDE